MNNILLFDYIKRFTERVLAIAASGYSSAISGREGAGTTTVGSVLNLQQKGEVMVGGWR